MDYYDLLLATKLSGGGGGGGGGKTSLPLKDVNFYDYDGTVVYAYTKNEWANVTDLPANPSHNGLTAQGWNFTKAEIDSLLAKIHTPLSIGQTYITSSGKTEVDISLPSYLLSPYFSLCVNGTAEIDWGDGNTTTLTGNNIDTIKNTQHTYASLGDYTIKVSVLSGKIALNGDVTSHPKQILNSGITAGYQYQDTAYQNCVKRVRIGEDVQEIKYMAFAYCSSLEYITIPNGVAIEGGWNFYHCCSLHYLTIPADTIAKADYVFAETGLKAISWKKQDSSVKGDLFFNVRELQSIYVPEGTTTISTHMFGNCSSLYSITLPSTTTTIGSNALDHCASCLEIHILATSVPSLQSNSFNNMQSTYIVYVPQESLNDYKTATVWSTIASRIVGE